MQAAHGMGEVHAGDPDADGVIRRVPLAVAVGNKLYPTLAGDALRVGVGGQTAQVKVTKDGFIDRMRDRRSDRSGQRSRRAVALRHRSRRQTLCVARRFLRCRFRCCAHHRPPGPDRHHGRRVEGYPRDAVGAGHAGRRDPCADPGADHQQSLSNALIRCRPDRAVLSGRLRRRAAVLPLSAQRDRRHPGSGRRAGRDHRRLVVAVRREGLPVRSDLSRACRDRDVRQRHADQLPAGREGEAQRAHGDGALFVARPGRPGQPASRAAEAGRRTARADADVHRHPRLHPHLRIARPAGADAS